MYLTESKAESVNRGRGEWQAEGEEEAECH